MTHSLMIVDDSATMRKIVMRTVRMSGIHVEHVVEAGNGVEALERLEECPVDVILCDVNMPKMDGAEFVRKVRENDAYQDIKIIMVSTESCEEFIVDLLDHGADGYITKPFTPDRFSFKLGPLLIIIVFHLRRPPADQGGAPHPRRKADRRDPNN